MLELYEKIGTCKYRTITNHWANADVYTCNALFSVVDKDFNLIVFFSDLDHFKNCLGFRNKFDNLMIQYLNYFKLKSGIKTTYGISTESIVSILNRSGIKASIF